MRVSSKAFVRAEELIVVKDPMATLATRYERWCQRTHRQLASSGMALIFPTLLLSMTETPERVTFSMRAQVWR